MVVLEIAAHKRTHTVVAVDGAGRKLAAKTTTATTSEDHLEMLRWAEQFGADRTWAVEDCRHLSRRLEADLLAAGERIVRVPPKLMAHARDSARTYGKSEPIDALAVARAALREPNLPVAELDGPSRDALDRVAARLSPLDGMVATLAADLVERCRSLTVEINTIERDIAKRTARTAPTLLQLPGVGALTAAKIVGEVADARWFRSKDAFARHNGIAPLPVSSGNRERHRLSRTGNRRLNCAIHRIAITQGRCHPDARAYLQRRTTTGDTRTEALQALKRRLSDIVYRVLLADATSPQRCIAEAA